MMHLVTRWSDSLDAPQYWTLTGYQPDRPRAFLFGSRLDAERVARETDGTVIDVHKAISAPYPEKGATDNGTT